MTTPPPQPKKAHPRLVALAVLATTALLPACSALIPSPDADHVVSTFLQGATMMNVSGATNGWFTVEDFRTAYGFFPGTTEHNLNSLSERFAPDNITITCPFPTENSIPHTIEFQNAEPMTCRVDHYNRKIGTLWTVKASPTYGPDHQTVMELTIY